MKSSKSIKSFVKTLSETLEISKTYPKTENLPIPTIHHQIEKDNISDIWIDTFTRTMIVTSIAAYDRYFTDRFLEALIPYIKANEISKKFSTFLEKNGMTTHLALNLINQSRPRSKFKNEVRKKLNDYVTQNNSKINNLYANFGFKDLLSQAESKSKKKRIVARINKLIKYRNEIVHEARADSNGKLKRFRFKDFNPITNTIVDMAEFMLSVDGIISSKNI